MPKNYYFFLPDRDSVYDVLFFLPYLWLRSPDEKKLIRFHTDRHPGSKIVIMQKFSHQTEHEEGSRFPLRLQDQVHADVYLTENVSSKLIK